MSAVVPPNWPLWPSPRLPQFAAAEELWHRAIEAQNRLVLPLRRRWGQVAARRALSPCRHAASPPDSAPAAPVPATPTSPNSSPLRTGASAARLSAPAPPLVAGRSPQ